jgi:hypothetical protein
MLSGKIKSWVERCIPYFGFVIFKNGTFATVTVTPIANTTYTAQYFTPFNDASWNFGDMAPTAISVLGDFFAQPLGNQIIEGSILVNILGIIWVRQDDAAIPLFLLWALSAVFFGMGLIPAEWQWFLIAIQAIVVMGIAYTLYRGRRGS